MSAPTRTVTDPTGVSACAAAAPIAAVTPAPGAQAILLPPVRKQGIGAMLGASCEPASIANLDPGAAAAGIVIAMSFPPMYHPKRPKSGRGYPRGQRA